MFTLNVIGGARTDSIAGINTSVKYTPRDGDVIATENAVFVRVHLTATYGLHTTYPAGLCCLCGLIARFEEPRITAYTGCTQYFTQRTSISEPTSLLLFIFD